MDKQELRLSITNRLQQMTEQEREAESQAICRHLRQLLGGKPKTVAAFMPYADEPDIRPLLQELLAAGWSIAMPVIEHGNRLVFHAIADLSHSAMIVSEILAKSPGADESLIGDVLVPGRAFTAAGLRLGRGGGSYDEWIGRTRKYNPNTRFIGVCFGCQVVADLPTEIHDQIVDIVVTSQGIITAKSL